MQQQSTPDYRYHSTELAHTADYLLPTLEKVLADLRPRKVFELGCGNGSVAKHLSARYDIIGIDASESGIALANKAYPEVRLEVASAYDDLAGRYGSFDLVLSLEVVEHLYDPRLYAKRLFELTRPGGSIVLSTPYHGYWKNLALAVSGKMDAHFTALWDGGHIKFWSVRTLTALLSEAGFGEFRFHRVGRFPALAKSMICVAARPGA